MHTLTTLQTQVALTQIQAALSQLPSWENWSAVLALNDAIDAWESAPTGDLKTVIDELLQRADGDVTRTRLFTQGLPLSGLPLSARRFGDVKKLFGTFLPPAAQPVREVMVTTAGDVIANRPTPLLANPAEAKASLGKE